MKSLKSEIKVMKEKKIEKRKEMKELRKIKNKQKEYNEIKSGKFEVIKNPKNIKKWSKKMKQQLIKLPAEVFESIIRKWKILYLFCCKVFIKIIFFTNYQESVSKIENANFLNNIFIN